MLLTIVPAPLMILLLLDTTALMLVQGYHHHQQPTNSRCIPLSSRRIPLSSRRIPLSSRRIPRCDTKYLSGAVTPALQISYDDRESDKEEMLSISVRDDPLSRITLDDILVPPRVALCLVTIVLASEALLVVFSMVVGDFFQVFPFAAPYEFHADQSSAVLALSFALPLSAAGLLLTTIPWAPLRDISRDTSIFALRLLGRRSSPWTAMAVSLLISVAAGICEEVAFRGFVYNAIWQTSVFGASTFLELLFGLVFAMSYKLSGYNLFVPIVVHVVYDFVVLFVTWLGSTAEFKRRIDEMEWDILTVPADTPLPPQIDILARLSYSMIDSNKDGFIDEGEFVSGLYLFSTTSLPYAKMGRSEEKQMFRALDADEDGLVSYREYCYFFRDMINRWLTVK